MGKLAFVMHGPQGGQVIEMDEKDFAKAEKDGWVVDFEKANKGGDPDPFRGFTIGEHEHAEAYLTSKGLYPNREMRAQPPGTEPVKVTPAKPEPEADKDEQTDTAKPKPAAKPAKK